MDIITAIKLIKEVGIPVGAFALCAWMTIYIVKRLASTIDKLSANIEKSGTRMEIFTSRVRSEHDAFTKNMKAVGDKSKEEHEALMAQHRQMIEALGRINGYRK